MNSLEKLQSQIDNIKARNQRVEADKVANSSQQMTVHYRPFQASDRTILKQLMQNLSIEDYTGAEIPEKNIESTLDTLSKHPDLGSILMIEKEEKVIGYAILINFWSNEFGGKILNIDELYLLPEFRSQGIGSGFIQHLAESKFGNAVFLQLEVTPGNARAKKLYEKLGFKLHEYETLKMPLN